MTIAIIGAGLSGLTTAYLAKKAGQQVVLIEKSDRAGGVIRSRKEDGFLLEYGPNTVQLKPVVYDLIHSLNLDSQMELASLRTPRYVQFEGRLHMVPMSPLSLFTSTLFSFRGKLRLFKEPFVSPTKSTTDETLYSFCERRLGSEAAERLMAPFISGIWAGNAHELSARSAFPTLLSFEKDHGGLLKGAIASRRSIRKNWDKQPPRGLMTFPQGIETIVQTMASFLKPELSTNESITEIQQLSEKEWVLTSNKRTIKASHLVLATPAKEAGQLIQKIAPEATDSLNQIPYTRLVVLHVGFKKEQIGNKASGFGYLVAPSEESDILGCLWNSNLFQNRAPTDSALFTVFMGGQSNPRIISATDLDLINRATEAIRPILSLKGNPIFTRLTRYEKAIPQYTIGHQDRMETLDKVEVQRPGLYFAGNYRGGISVGDVIQSAKILSSRLL